MSELSPRARAVMEAARRAPCQPSQESLDRLERGVLVGLAATAGKASGGTAAWSAVVGKLVVSSALVLFGVVVGAVMVSRSPPVTPVPQVVIAPPSPPPASLPPAEREPEPAREPAREPEREPELAREPEPGPEIRSRNPSTTNPAPVPETPRPSPPPPTVETPQVLPPAPTADLAAELALLRTAMQHLDALGWKETLTTLDQHDAEFPRSALRDEADVLRVLALCGLERVSEASNLAAQLHARAPRSPVLTRLTASCVDP